MSKIFNVIGIVTVKEGTVEEVKTALTELAVESRKEPGNISYQVLEDSTKPNTVFSVEQWENEQVEAKHWETEHLKATLAKIGDKIAGEPIVSKGFTF